MSCQFQRVMLVCYSAEDLRSKHRGEDKQGLGIVKPKSNLLLIKCLVLDTSLVARDTLDSNEPLAVAQELSGRGSVREEEPDNERPQARGGAELCKR